MIDLELVKENPADFTYYMSKSAQVIGGSIVEMVYKIKQITIGPHQIKNLTVHATDFTFLKKTFGKETRVIVGTNVIGMYNWEFDTAKTEFSMSR